MPKPVYVVALTGGIGSGKSTVAALFEQHGAHIIDTDDISHQATGVGGAALVPICSVFGKGVLAADGSLDRTRMRTLAFADQRARAALEGILHPIIRGGVESALGRESATVAPYVVLAVPLLFETMGYRDRICRSLAVDCQSNQQRQRVTQRSGLSAPETDRIIASQLCRSLRLQLADDVISNTGATAELGAKVTFLHTCYQSLATEKTREMPDNRKFVNSLAFRHNSPSHT